MASSTHQLLARLIAQPELAAAVRSAPPAVINELVAELGLADSFELMALVSPEQLVALADAELWRADDSFDPDAFTTWLEVLFEGGEAFVAERLAQLPEELLVMALAEALLVLDIDTLGIGMAGAAAHEAALVEQALDACLYLELGNYTLVCRDALAWDVVIAALLALDQRDHDRVVALLEACARASAEQLDSAAALHGVLTRAQMVREDAGADREERRSAQGYLSRADAEAFARLAEADCEGLPERDPITRAYLRELDPEAGSGVTPPMLARLLERRAVPSQPQLPSPDVVAFRAALAALPLEVQRLRQVELVYLANVLVTLGQAGAQDAAEAVTARCAEGYRRLRALDPEAPEPLARVGCDQLYRLAAS